MSGRVSEAIMPQNVGYAAGRQNAMLDLRYGGQNGFSPNESQWVSNQAYVRKNLICLLVEAPKGFALLPNGDRYTATLRSLVELHAVSIDGLQQGLEVAFEDTSPVGGGNEMHQDFTNVTKQRSNPVFRFNEKYGLPVASFLRAWITNLMMDPESKVANISTLPNVKPSDMLADMYSATMAFIEPDPTHTKVVKSWLCTNMWPQGTGDINGRRDLTAPGEAITYDINFTAISQVGLGIDAFCQGLLDSINITGANPYNRGAFVQGIAADVAATTESYTRGIANLAANSLRV